MLQVAIPAFPVADLPGAIEVYVTGFGFTLVHADDGMAILQRDGIELHLWLAGDQTWQESLDPARPVRNGAESFLAGTTGCRIRTTELAVLFEELQAAGVLHPQSTAIETRPWGTAEFHTLDRDGNLLTFFEPL
jgi:catechol 2,3-dioxygenase-like lactoylglutathione lyase family enzyme